MAETLEPPTAVAPYKNGKRALRQAHPSTSSGSPAHARAPLELTINFDGLTIGDLEALEEASRTTDIIAWLVTHANANAKDLRQRPLLELRDILERVGVEIREALKVPKAKARS